MVKINDLVIVLPFQIPDDIIDVFRQRIDFSNVRIDFDNGCEGPFSQHMHFCSNLQLQATKHGRGQHDIPDGTKPND